MSPDMLAVWRSLRSTDEGPSWNFLPDRWKAIVTEAYLAGQASVVMAKGLEAARDAGRKEGYSLGHAAGCKETASALASLARNGGGK